MTQPVALITGCSSGIGRALADAFQAAGYCVWASARKAEDLAALSAAIQKAQRELKTLQDYAEVWQMLADYRIIRFESSATVHVQKYYAIQNIIRNFVQDDAQPKAEDFAWLIQMMEKWHPQNMHLQQKTAQEIAQICQRCIVDYAG